MSKRNGLTPVATAFAVILIGIIAVLGMLVLVYPSNEGRQTGAIQGWVKIGPLCPVEPCKSAVNPYSTRSLMLSSGGTNLYVPLQSDGSFASNVAVGTYQVTITSCDYPGCRSLPVSLTVSPGVVSHLNLTIDTGIR